MSTRIEEDNGTKTESYLAPTDGSAKPRLVLHNGKNVNDPRDGQPFPAPNQRARPASQIVIAPVAGGEPKILTDLDIRPESLAWHPNGELLVFIADSQWRQELRRKNVLLGLSYSAGTPVSGHHR